MSDKPIVGKVVFEPVITIPANSLRVGDKVRLSVSAPQPRMTREEFRYLLFELRRNQVPGIQFDQCSTFYSLHKWVEEETKRHGFSDWLDAYSNIAAPIKGEGKCK